MRSTVEKPISVETIKYSELRYRRLFEAAQDGILILDAKMGAITDVNPFLIKLLGYSREEFMKKKLWEVGAFKDIEACQEAFEALQQNDYIRYEDLPLKAKDGRLVQVEFVSNVYLAGDEKVIQCNIRDITTRKLDEEQNRQQTSLLENMNDAVVASDGQYRLNIWNKAAEALYGWKTDEVLGHEGKEILHTEWPGVEADKMKWAIAEKGHWRGEVTQARKDGTRIPVELSVFVLRDANGFITGYVSINHDITERRQVEEGIQRQLEHLTALSAIDRVMSANVDLGIILSEILMHVILELDIDAVDILILNSNTQMLEYYADRGFRTKAIKNRQISLSNSIADHLVLDDQLVQILKLTDEPINLFLTNLLMEEKFVCYYGVPLMAKGQVKGVMEVFHRSELEPEPEWYSFLNDLAGQAAIAIENATLLDSLQHSNLELTKAYNATIEGWSHALDLRDKETEGHTQRVTTLTVNLARVFGLSDKALEQVRWGALLHDIGKMGIPDRILHKTDPLTTEDWLAMKKHPSLALEMLSPIRYLHLALDIPYCHHEKWDGTGYPRGLKGDQIPLVARIFSVVDVWDALKSDRPYRPAWKEDKIREYIKALSGSHFDPQVVDKFMQFLI